MYLVPVISLYIMLYNTIHVSVTLPSPVIILPLNYTLFIYVGHSTHDVYLSTDVGTTVAFKLFVLVIKIFTYVPILLI